MLTEDLLRIPGTGLKIHQLQARPRCSVNISHLPAGSGGICL
jgi:hypothetical protein